jgi:hypothetical protein
LYLYGDHTCARTQRVVAWLEEAGLGFLWLPERTAAHSTTTAGPPLLFPSAEATQPYAGLDEKIRHFHHTVRPWLGYAGGTWFTHCMARSRATGVACTYRGTPYPYGRYCGIHKRLLPDKPSIHCYCSDRQAAPLSFPRIATAAGLQLVPFYLHAPGHHGPQEHHGLLLAHPARPLFIMGWDTNHQLGTTAHELQAWLDDHRGTCRCRFTHGGTRCANYTDKDGPFCPRHAGGIQIQLLTEQTS